MNPKYSKGDVGKIVSRIHNHKFDIGEKVRIMEVRKRSVKYGTFTYDAKSIYTGVRYFITENDFKPLLKVGDEAIVVARECDHSFNIGERVVITSIQTSHFYASSIDRKDVSYFVGLDDVKALDDVEDSGAYESKPPEEQLRDGAIAIHEKMEALALPLAELFKSRLQ